MLECEAALEHAQETGSGTPIDASNAANSAFAIFDFDRAESYSILPLSTMETPLQHGQTSWWST